MLDNKLLLHICCAPDATVPWASLSRDMSVAGYFYGSNIHPQEEYAKRREAVAKLMGSVGGRCIYPDYLPDSWLRSALPYAGEPEGGKRCALCFRLQLEHAAREAAGSGCSHLCTTLTISPHKNVTLINGIGNEIAENYGLAWVGRVWRSNNGFPDSVKAARALGLYRQNYCGCVYSIKIKEAEI
ncbi:MAG: epoxyqueuosine reductase QueH [Synergistaceae bacterium]|nr:epoxyqueuosine reductase QueH [Synergistaceae bacterium]